MFLNDVVGLYFHLKMLKLLFLLLFENKKKDDDVYDDVFYVYVDENDEKIYLDVYDELSLIDLVFVHRNHEEIIDVVELILVHLFF